MVTEKKIWEKLRQVVDPELGVNIVDLGLIYNIDVNQKLGNVNIKMTLTSYGCPLSAMFEEEIKNELLKLKGVKNVKINLVWEPVWTTDRLSEEAKEKLGFHF